MIHTYTRNGTTRYGYYVCLNATKQDYKSCETRSIPVQEIEDFVVDRITTIGGEAELVERIERKARARREQRLSTLDAEKNQIEKSLRQQAKLVAGKLPAPAALFVRPLQILLVKSRFDERRIRVLGRIKIVTARRLATTWLTIFPRKSVQRRCR